MRTRSRLCVSYLLHATFYIQSWYCFSFFYRSLFRSAFMVAGARHSQDHLYPLFSLGSQLMYAYHQSVTLLVLIFLVQKPRFYRQMTKPIQQPD